MMKPFQNYTDGDVLNIGMAQIVEIVPAGTQGPIYFPYSIHPLLMTYGLFY